MTVPITSDDLLAKLSALPKGRHIVAVVGPPASGKSTLADRLVEGLNMAQAGRAALVPMDGFHLDDRVLVPRGDRPRKGAPHTYDVGGLRSLLQRLRRNDEPEVAIPVFERAHEYSRAAAAMVPQSVQVVVVEGNWLLLNEAPWRDLKPLYDLSVMVRVSEAELRRRLVERWISYDLPEAEITCKVEENDMPNGRLVLRQSLPADYDLSQD